MSTVQQHAMYSAKPPVATNYAMLRPLVAKDDTATPYPTSIRISSSPLLDQMIVSTSSLMSSDPEIGEYICPQIHN